MDTCNTSTTAKSNEHDLVPNILRRTAANPDTRSDELCIGLVGKNIFYQFHTRSKPIGNPVSVEELVNENCSESKLHPLP